MLNQIINTIENAIANNEEMVTLYHFTNKTMNPTIDDLYNNMDLGSIVTKRDTENLEAICNYFEKNYPNVLLGYSCGHYVTTFVITLR